MTTKDVLAILLLNTWEQGVDDQARSLAPIIERALRAERKAGFLRAAEFYYDGGYNESVRLTSLDIEQEPVTAGVTAMMEGSDG